MDWDKLKIFHAVAEAGNFTKATYILNLSQSAISRQIKSLEQELKTKLFELLQLISFNTAFNIKKKYTKKQY